MSYPTFPYRMRASAECLSHENGRPLPFGATQRKRDISAAVWRQLSLSGNGRHKWRPVPRPPCSPSRRLPGSYPNPTWYPEDIQISEHYLSTEGYPVSEGYRNAS
jgi:hypothetical protein